MEIVALVLGGCAFLTGIVSAYYWWRSAKVVITPQYLKAGQIEPVDPVQAQASWIVGVLEAARASARLSQIAAIWTAVTVMFTGAAALAGAIFG